MALPEYLLDPVPFQAYGLSHWLVLVIFATVALLLLLTGRSRDERHRRRVGKALAWTILAVMLPFQIGAMSPPFWSIQYSLPFQLCDMAWMVAAVALLSKWRWACTLLYYWGLTLTVQGLITPALGFGFPHVAFFMFFAMHCLVVWAALYVVCGLGYRPDWRSYRFAVAVTIGWMALMLGFNSLFGTNYMFVSAKPQTASILDALGPWPWYLFWEILIGAGAWALITLPWEMKRKEER